MLEPLVLTGEYPDIIRLGTAANPESVGAMVDD
jgi:hypothetical protein